VAPSRSIVLSVCVTKTKNSERLELTRVVCCGFGSLSPTNTRVNKMTDDGNGLDRYQTTNEAGRGLLRARSLDWWWL
jgi:hypothetical protein